MKKQVDVAIIGMSGIFPGAANIGSFWKNIENKVDAIELVPENRLDAAYFDPLQPAVDRFYCRRGGFIDKYAVFDPIQFGILPLAVEGTEPEHLLTLSLAHQALCDADVFEKELKLDKTAIIIGKGNYAGPGATRGAEIVRTGEQILQVLKQVLPNLKEEEADKIKKEFQLKKGRFGPDVAMGLVPNLLASLVANRLDLGGTAYTVDAACASSLIAVDHAVQELTMGRADMVIAGGVHAGQNAPFWSIFTQLGALSRKQQIRPFDQRADGLLIGEGCGFVVLKKLEDAIRDGHRIYAVIKGVGISSDGAGTSVMSPSVKGQSKAITQAWQNAQIDVSQIGYIEAHGTGTPLGDRTEIETLTQIFGLGKNLPKAGIGSVKSMIGHAMPAAGIAGLIKTTLALYHGKLPATLHCEEPLELLEASRFRAVKETIDWDPDYLPRRAGVNAFGFGGINAHIVVEGYNEPQKATKSQFNGHSFAQKDPVLLLARESLEALIKAMENNETNTGQGNYRVAVFNPTPERITKALKIVGKNLPWRNKQDIWYSNNPLLEQGGKIAFLFPGLDGLTAGETDSVATYFDLHDEVSKQTDADTLLSIALKAINRSHILDSALKQLNIQPHLNAGHSLGEWLAGRSSELVAKDTVMEMLDQLDPSLYEIKDAKFLVVGCGYDQLKPLLEETKDIYLSIDNCPQQVILCGSNKAVDEFSQRLKSLQLFHQELPFQSGFHSPFIKNKLDALLGSMGKMTFQKGKIPLWSATTLSPYPDSTEELRTLSIEHLIKPVRFRELTEKLYNEGARVFIQVGSGGLIGFIDDTLKQKSYSAISANVPIRPGIAQLQRVLAALFVEGKAIDLAFMGIEPTKNKTGSVVMKLELGSPFVSHISALSDIGHTAIPANKIAPILQDTASPLLHAFINNCNDIVEMQTEIINLFAERNMGNGNNNLNQSTQIPSVPLKQPIQQALEPMAPEPIRQPISKQLNITLENSPYLIDHSLLRQKAGWPHAEDMEPVIPMTMALELFGEIAHENAPNQVVQKIMNIAVFQWMSVANPFKETIKGIWKEQNKVLLTLENYTNAEVLLASKYNEVPQTEFNISQSLDIQISPEQIYKSRMFHGPAYQGIKQVLNIAEKGIRGIIVGGAGKGSLLDNAGQLFGLWLQLTLEKENVAFPVKISEVEYYGDRNDQQGEFECTCMITNLNNEFATGSFILKRNGQVWAIIRGWQNRRLEIDQPLWLVCMEPLQHSLSTELAPGVFMYHNAYNRVASWGFVLKRYFNTTERAYHDSLLPNKRKEWMISRVAQKDAIRDLLFRSTAERYYPIEFEIRSDEIGKPYAHGEMVDDIHISLAHKKTDAVAIARKGRAVGIDIELISQRSQGFIELSYTPSELALLGSRDQNEWLTRYWVAKEAYGKHIGKGLKGNPKAYVIQEINGEELNINNVIIKTLKHHNHIIGWTL